MNKIIILFLIFLFTLIGQVNAAQRIVMPNITTQEVLNEITKYVLLNFSSYSIKNKTDNSISFNSKVGVSNTTQGVMLGHSSYESDWNFNVVQNGNDVVTIASFTTVITYKNGVQEVLSPKNKDEENLYRCLTYIRTKLCGGYSYGFSYEKKKNSIKITDIEPNSPMAQAGLQVNDVIVSINNNSLKKMDIVILENMLDLGGEVTFTTDDKRVFKVNPIYIPPKK